MNEYEALRREIEVRIQRETLYTIELYKRSPDHSSVEREFFKRAIEENEKKIALIGKYLLELGSEWEKVVQKEFPRV